MLLFILGALRPGHNVTGILSGGIIYVRDSVFRRRVRNREFAVSTDGHSTFMYKQSGQLVHTLASVTCLVIYTCSFVVASAR